MTLKPTEKGKEYFHMSRFLGEERQKKRKRARLEEVGSRTICKSKWNENLVEVEENKTNVYEHQEFELFLKSKRR